MANSDRLEQENQQLRAELAAVKQRLANQEERWGLVLQRELQEVIGISGDITDRHQKEESLKKQSERDSLLSSIARDLIEKDLEVAINLILEKIGHFIDCDRSYIIDYSPCREYISMNYEWCNPEIAPIIDDHKNIPLANFPWISQQLETGEPLNIPTVDKLPPEAQLERESLETHQVRSLFSRVKNSRRLSTR